MGEDLNLNEIMKRPEVRQAVKQFRKNPKDIMKMLNESMKFMAKFESFSDTYLGVYDSKGNQLRKGDRDIIFEALGQLLDEISEIKQQLAEINDKIDKIMLKE